MEQKITFYSEGIPVNAVLGIPDDHTPGQRRAAVRFCHGVSLTKESWLPAYAPRFREAGSITLTFDYRHFGESGGLPRQRLNPAAQVMDARCAVTYLQSRTEVAPDRIVRYGTSFGCGIATAAAGQDDRVACVVGTAGPGDCMRQFRHCEGFDAFLEKVRHKRAKLVTRCEVDYLSVPRMLRRDPELEAELEQLAIDLPKWRPEITFASMLAILEFKPEAWAPSIRGAAMWSYGEGDLLVPLPKGQSYYAKAREPKSLVILQGIKHREVYDGGDRDTLLHHALGWFSTPMPALNAPEAAR